MNSTPAGVMVPHMMGCLIGVPSLLMSCFVVISIPVFFALSWVFSPSHFFTSGTDASSSETISIVPSLDKTIAGHRYHEGRESRTRCEIFTAFEFDIFHLPPSNFYKITKEVYI